MFDSTDILYIVLAFCALWFTAFVCWVIWQVAMILKNVNDTLAQARDIMEKMETAVFSIRQKFDGMSGTAMAMSNAVHKVVEYVIDRKMKKGEEQEDMPLQEEEEPQKSKKRFTRKKKQEEKE